MKSRRRTWTRFFSFLPLINAPCYLAQSGFPPNSQLVTQRDVWIGIFHADRSPNSQNLSSFPNRQQFSAFRYFHNRRCLCDSLHLFPALFSMLCNQRHLLQCLVNFLFTFLIIFHNNTDLAQLLAQFLTRRRCSEVQQRVSEGQVHLNVASVRHFVISLKKNIFVNYRLSAD